MDKYIEVSVTDVKGGRLYSAVLSDGSKYALFSDKPHEIAMVEYIKAYEAYEEAIEANRK